MVRGGIEPWPSRKADARTRTGDPILGQNSIYVGLPVLLSLTFAKTRSAWEQSIHKLPCTRICVETVRAVCVEIVLHQHNLFSVWIHLITEKTQHSRIIVGRAPFSHHHLALSC